VSARCGGPDEHASWVGEHFLKIDTYVRNVMRAIANVFFETAFEQ
jgi:hypothetical protein